MNADIKKTLKEGPPTKYPNKKFTGKKHTVAN